MKSTRLKHICLIFGFLFMMAIPHPILGEPSIQPIIFAVQPGFLYTNSFRDLQDGWHPLLKTELHAIRRPWLGYILTFGMSHTQNIQNRQRTTRYITTGLSFFKQFEKTRIEYRLQYGSLFTVTRAATVFIHSTNILYKIKTPWQFQAGIEHIVPNDWIFGTNLNEKYGSFIFSVGGGFSF